MVRRLKRVGDRPAELLTWHGPWRRPRNPIGGVPLEVATFELLDERLRLFYVSAQHGRFSPQCTRSSVASPHILAFYPTQLAGHLAQLDAQGTDELDGLSDLPSIHRVILPPATLYPAASGIKTSANGLQALKLRKMTCRLASPALVNCTFICGNY